MLSLLTLLVLGPLPAQEPSREAETALKLRVNHSIARAVDYLRTEAAPDGAFTLHAQQHPGGATALAALALAEAGVRRTDPVLVQALEALEGQEFESVYSASMHLLLCDTLSRTPERLEAARASMEFLVEHQRRGVWAYPWSHLCMSNTQFALMALRAAMRLGLEPPEAALVDAASGLWLFQNRDGGFAYIEGGRANSSMTAAALAGVAALDELAAQSKRLRSELRKHAKRLAAAEEWLAGRFDPTRVHYANGAWTPFWVYSYMWAVERWCGLTAREEFAGRDWYREGARWLVETQAPDGSWTNDDHPLENTCFALLFLRRATMSRGGELDEIYERAEREFAQATLADPRPDPAARRLTDWWLAGPWQGKDDGALLGDPPFDPERIKPKHRGKLARRPWQRVSLDAQRWTNLDEFSGIDANLSRWCLSTLLVHDPTPGGPEAQELALWLELEDGWDVRLDGERVSHERRVQSAINGNVRIPLTLSAGVHRLDVLVEDVGGAAAFGALLSAAKGGAPSSSITSMASLDPDEGR